MHTSQTRAGAGELVAFHSASPRQTAPAPITAWCWSPGKRILDLAVSLFVLALAWPVMLIAAAAIKMGSSGPVLFRQKRVGKNGKHFDLLKFRSMRVDAERQGPGITCGNDPRILPVGKILRKWKVDELPQLFNVVRGEMSLVGPRPDLPEFCATLLEDQRSILELRPGVTGAATLKYHDEEAMLANQSGNGITDYYVNTLYPEKVKLDLEYAREASFARDCRILMKTFTAIFS